jgi:hypothetical protein
MLCFFIIRPSDLIFLPRTPHNLKDNLKIVVKRRRNKTPHILVAKKKNKKTEPMRKDQRLLPGQNTFDIIRLIIESTHSICINER